MSRWYIIHAYSGFENKVRDAIQSEAARMGLTPLVEQIEVPTETVTEIKRGKKVQAERKFMPGYVLAKLELNDEVYHLVKNTPKVTGFLGPNGKPQPIPTPRPRGCSTPATKAPHSRPSRRSPSTMRSATRSRCSTAPSPPSTAPSRTSISTAGGSRCQCRSSAGPRRWSWSSSKLSG